MLVKKYVLVTSLFVKALTLFEKSDELEDDMFDKAWGLESESRLSCQSIVGDEDVVVDIPKYTVNMVSENH